MARCSRRPSMKEPCRLIWTRSTYRIRICSSAPVESCASVIFISGKSRTANFTSPAHYGRIFVKKNIFRRSSNISTGAGDSVERMNNSRLRYRRPWGRVEANLKSRLATGFVGIPLLILIVGWGDPWLFTGLILLLNFAALHEFFAMAFPERAGERVFGIVFAMGLSLW